MSDGCDYASIATIEDVAEESEDTPASDDVRDAPENDGEAVEQDNEQETPADDSDNSEGADETPILNQREATITLYSKP